MQAALRQIEEKKYREALVEKGFAKERIRAYGFAFQGEKVLLSQFSCVSSVTCVSI